METETDNARLMRRATIMAVAAPAAMIAVKLVAYLMTGSVAILSSLVDSLVDMFASGVNLVAVHIALQPPDREHRFGHGKAEGLAGLAQAAFISGSGVFLLLEVLNRLLHPKPLEYISVGIAVMLVSILITVALVYYQRLVVARTGSVAINADSLHYRSDVYVNLGVILAMMLDWVLGWHWADPVIALMIVVYILYCAWTIARQSLDQLMDRELPDDERQRIKFIVLSHPRVCDLHELRTRSSGLDQFIQLHLVLEPQFSLQEAHDIAVEVQDQLQEAFPKAQIIIHQDPADDSVPGEPV